MARQEINGRPIIWRPQPRQAAFMRRSEDEALYGGAAGGGKSDALVIEALRQVDVPNYRALILRKTFPQLRELIDKTMQYYKPVFPKARYNASNHCWTFPSGMLIHTYSFYVAPPSGLWPFLIHSERARKNIYHKVKFYHKKNSITSLF